MSKISNVLLMIEYLSSGRKYSIKELSEKLEVSPRMIRVYKDEMEKAGIYVDTIKGPYGGYVLNQNINVPKRFITPKEININNKEFYNLINKAIKEKRKCYIEYYSKDRKEISERTIHPYNLILLGNEWGVAAYCEYKEEIRHFYINRIKSINMLEDSYN
jgi:predicted DNA-binding transcriptional regulator YafY